jgi:hypothetical protein
VTDETAPDGTLNDRKEYVAALLRRASARARSMASDIDFVGMSLTTGHIGPETAIALLIDAGAGGLVLTTTLTMSPTPKIEGGEK